MAKEILTSKLSSDQVQKLKKVIQAGLVYKQQIKDLQASYKEALDLASSDLGIDKKVLTETIATVFKQDFYDKTEKQEDVEAIMALTGNLPERE